MALRCAIAFSSSAAEAVKAEKAATPRRWVVQVAKAGRASAAQATQEGTITLVAAVPEVSNIVADPAAAAEWLKGPSTAPELRAMPDRGVKAAMVVLVAPGIAVTATALVVAAPGAATTAQAAAEVARAAITAASQAAAAEADRRTSSPARSAFKLWQGWKKATSNGLVVLSW
ncbi:MAG TPA: hypothetical protein VGX91_00290 [Candidatus Cybelea sp.]|nr:hypothetical protein [Candidatus Cybelea sp.]